MADEHGYSKYVHSARCTCSGYLIALHPDDLLWKKGQESYCFEVLRIVAESFLIPKVR